MRAIWIKKDRLRRKGGRQAARCEQRSGGGIRRGLSVAAGQQKAHGFEAGVSMARIPKGRQTLSLGVSKVDGGEIRYKMDDVVPHRREGGEEGRLRQSDRRRWEAEARQCKGSLGGGKGERTGRGDVGASGDALSGVAVLFITTTTTTSRA